MHDERRRSEHTKSLALQDLLESRIERSRLQVLSFLDGGDRDADDDGGARALRGTHPRLRRAVVDVRPMRGALDECGSKLRLTYCEGALELVRPSHDHQITKTILARLVEAYIDVRGLDIDGGGSTTFRTKRSSAGSSPTSVAPPGR